MAIQGQAYNKTSWAFEERPVSSAKLNQWDDRIEGALEVAFHLLNLAWGGGSGVLRGAPAGELAVTATAPASLRVAVGPGYAFVDGYPYRLAAGIETAAIAPPVSEERIDLVQADLATWGVTVKAGAESATPEAPEPDSGSIALAALVLRPGMGSITNADDSVNGYIVDARDFL